jgi:hypothetical protein
MAGPGSAWLGTVPFRAANLEKRRLKGMRKSVKQESPPKGVAQFEIPADTWVAMMVEIEGTTSLIQNRFTDEKLDKIEASRAGTDTEGRTRVKRDEVWRAAAYKVGGKYAHPSVGLHEAMVDASRILKMSKINANLVMGAITLPDDYLMLGGDAPTERRDRTRTSTGGLDLRYRPEYLKWGAKVLIEYDSAKLGPAQILTLLNAAGKYVGLGELRKLPKDRKTPGNHGLFRATAAYSVGIARPGRRVA